MSSFLNLVRFEIGVVHTSVLIAYKRIMLTALPIESPSWFDFAATVNPFALVIS